MVSPESGVARMFDGQVRERTTMQSEGVAVDTGVEEFVPLTVWLQRDQKSGRAGQPQEPERAEHPQHSRRYQLGAASPVAILAHNAV